jgi:hypothetical protein
VFPTAAPPAIMDLDVEAVRGSMDQQLQLTRKPQLSSRARQRLSVKSRKKLPLSPSSLAEQGGEGARKVLSTRSVSPPASRERGSEVERVSQDQSDAGTPGPSQPQLPALSVTMSDSCEPLRPLQLTASMSAVELRPPGVLTRTRDSALSTDSGLGGEFPSRDSASLSLHENRLGPVGERGQRGVAESGRLGVRQAHRKSMLLSELCVVSVCLPADVVQGQKGMGAVLKCRFSPYTQIECLRVALLKQFHEQYKVRVQQLSNLHLCHYLEEEGGWEWLEEDHALHTYQLPTECKLELKPLEPVYRRVRVVIPHLECEMTVEYDQFSTVCDVLHQVLSMASPPLDVAQGYSLYHVRLRANLEVGESMVHYQLLPSDVLECRLSVGRMQTVILTVKIPNIHSSRKVKVCLDETVGELISTLMRRVPDPESRRWEHMSLYLSTKDERGGVWMEDFKFLAAYKLKPTDVLEFKPKFRPMEFHLRVYPHDHSGDLDRPYYTTELLVAQQTLVSEVVRLLCTTASLEYDPRFYGLFLHDDVQLPSDASMWDHLDEITPAYQDSLVMHMLHKPIRVSFDRDPESYFSLLVDFSQPCQVVRDILCRRYGVGHQQKCVLKYEGIRLGPGLSLHNQGVVEQEHVNLVIVGTGELVSPLTSVGGSVSCGGTRSNPASPAPVAEDKRQSISSMVEDDANIWEEDLESESNIRYDRNGQVIGATLNKLVERVTSTRDHDLEFVKTFLFTYQAFTTPEKLLRKLIERYNVVCPEGMPLKEFDVMRQTIQARVINAVRLWVDLSVDFKDNQPLQDAVLRFVMMVLTVDHPKFCKPLRNAILVLKGVIQKRNLKTFREPLPPVKFPDTPSAVLSVFDFDPEEIARQMTIIDFSLFARIKPSELLNQAWQKPKYKDRAQNLLRLVERMNNLTLWVATTILSQRDVQERARRITDFVFVAEHLHRLHNYCTLLSILNGLAHPAITRLKKSFAKCDKVTSRKMEDLQQLARPGENCKLLRDELKKASNPCIPYLGLYMSDLTFLDNGNPNFHGDGLINFSKCRLIYNQIRDLILRQDKPYNFEEVPALHDSLMRFHFLDSEVLYDVSSQREPRK